MNRTQIGTISNYYGGLIVAEHDGKYFWCIENWDSNSTIDEFDEIPKSLYDELIKYNESLTHNNQ